MSKLKVGVLGATGRVGQRFLTLLANHPFFEVVAVAASPRSAGKTYREAVDGRWSQTGVEIPAQVADLTVQKVDEVGSIVDKSDFVCCALDMEKDAIRDLEDAYATAETPVISNNSAHRWTPDVPMFIPELNPEHAEIIPAQRKRLGTRNGFIAVKPNCSIQPYVPALHALKEFGPNKASVCTYQAISGAGKTFETYPEMVDNVIPFIGGEEEKSINEPLKIWGNIVKNEIVPARTPAISAQCIRVPVTDGHLAAVSVSFETKPSPDEIINRWRAFKGDPRGTGLPSSPTPFLTYFTEEDRPQTKLDRNAGNGMGVTLGRLRDDNVFDFRFIALSHNTVRGAAGGAVLMAELLHREGYLVQK
ncbi:MAG: aspartate-semialdehyde dehydrogenase [Candidatus Latescibacteria bacterium]|jgi:aspartate-semialdehyde dehydrogenase|nr:aspartate-semialdehyde dehydrogenase [Candidatus Latescibacterota bacterium]